MSPPQQLGGIMEQSELPEKVIRIEERMATKKDLDAIKNDIGSLERDLKKDIARLDKEVIGVRNDLKEMGIRFENRFDNLESLIKTNMLETENKLLKRIFGWGLGIFAAVLSVLSTILILVIQWKT